jgi:uncharacterized repeat protein (TIGR01451 family)/uncharacterized delta-60 repeat protein
LSLDTNGNILVGGYFTSYNTTNCNHIARLMTNGGLDPSFLPNTGNGRSNIGVDQYVNAITTDSNGNVVIGGPFTHVNGTNLNYLARLLPNGTVDPAFNPQIGPDGTVNSIAVTANNELVIGGIFQNYRLVSRPGVAEIQYDGSLDTNFTPGSGADGPVYAVTVQTDGDIVVGGQFRTFNSCRRLGVARLLPQGWVDTSFMDTAYNQYAGLINKYYDDPINTAYALAIQPDGNILMGGSFTNVGGGGTRDDIHSKINIARLIGASNPGPQTGGGGIGNCPGNITLTASQYNVEDTAGNLNITVQRVNGSLGPAQITLGTNSFTQGPGAATAADYGLVLPDVCNYRDIYQDNNFTILPYGLYSWRRCDGIYGLSTVTQPLDDSAQTTLNLSIHNNTSALQNLSAGLSELNVNALNLLSLGGVNIPLYPAFGSPSATLEIINNNFPPGVLGFTSTNYVTVDTASNVTLTVVRTNGSAGQVTVQYFTANGTAVSGTNFLGQSPGTSTTLTFPGGPNNTATLTIPIVRQSVVQPTTFFYVYLTNASYSGAFDTNIPPIVPAAATVTIIDGNFAPGHLSFSAPSYSTLKSGLATIGVQRTGGATGSITVQVGTSDGTATNGLNYTGVTNSLLWGDQDVSTKTITVQTLQDNTVDGTRTVNLSLFNATNLQNPSMSSQILTTPSNAVLSIQEANSYGQLTFAAPNFTVAENADQALITIVRTNGVTGTISVNLTTVNDTNVLLPNYPAYAGTNYGTVATNLIFGPGVTSQSIVVPIYDTSAGEAQGTNRIVELVLSGATPTNVLTQPVQVAFLNILDPNAVNTPAGSVDTTTQSGTGFNGPIYSMARQLDDSIIAGGAFTFFNDYPFDYVARINPAGGYDSSFLFGQSGPNGTVYEVQTQSPRPGQTNGPIIVSGNFTQVDQVNRPGIARMNFDGSLDESFNPGAGADNTIFAMAEAFLPSALSNQLAGYIYIGGSFANYNGISCGGIARLNATTNSSGFQGTFDPNFNPGQGATGSNAVIYALAVQANGQVIAGGDFTSFNNTTHNHLVRLNVDGSIDASFNPSTGAGGNGSVRAIAVQPDGKILIGGLFTNINGVNYNHLARLNTDGTLDTNFVIGVGGDNSVLALAIDDQERILVAGEFTRFSGVTRGGITRLNPDGSIDPTINFGSGADGGFVDSIVIQTNNEIDLAGGFSSFEGTSENNFVRLYGGAIYGDGQIQFSQATYGVLENGTNAVITLIRTGGEGTTALPTASIAVYTSDGTAVAGSNYTAVSTNVIFPYGETVQTITVPVTNNEIVANDTYLYLNFSNAINASIGTIPVARLYITNVNSAVAFSAASYNQAGNSQSQEANITLVRLGYVNSDVGVWVYTGTNGTAIPYTNYIPESNYIEFVPGVTTQYFNVPVTNAPNTFGDVTVDLEMTDPTNVYIGSPASAILDITPNNTSAGILAFSMTNYSVPENATNAIITVIRTNGSTGAVAVTLTTSNGTAIAGQNYLPVTATLNFSDAETAQSTNIPIIQQTTATPDLNLYLTLSNPQGGAVIGGVNPVTLTIQDDIEYFSFANAPYFVGEGAGILTLDIVRGGPSTNSATVNYYTSDLPNASEANGDAVAGVDYVPTSGTLTFAPNETFTTIPITILQGTTVNPPLSFYVNLTAAPPLQIINSPATVAILSDVTGFEFATNAYTVAENGTNLNVTITRVNPNTGAASVQFSTTDGTNLDPTMNAIHQVDYVSTNGVLTFLNGQASATVSVAILNPGMVENNKQFNLTLSNPKVLTLPNPSTNAYLLAPSNAVVTITNVLSGVSFSSASYTISECGVFANIPVVRSGNTNTLVNVTFSTTNGSAIDGTNYFGTNVSITFQPGQTSTNVQVQVINNHIIGPDHNVVLNLSNPQGAQLVNPSTSILTIQECNGAYIVKSGTAFVSGTTTNNGGVIFSNETVTVLLGLRDVAGTDTRDLVATLLATNGVTNITQGTNTYGVLVNGGPTVARPYTFTAVGSNGQTIIANLTLQDGSQVYSNVAFGFTLGGQTVTFSNGENLVLFGSNNPSLHEPPSKASDPSNPPNYGYPAAMSVTGILGNVTGVTVTLPNFGHSYPEDVELLLQSPTGQSTLLMNNCGGKTNVAHKSLTFSQSAGGPLPEFNAITSGTYLPSSYQFVENFPTNAAGQPEPPLPPFATNMNVFAGQPANGNWLLWASDDDTLDQGYISNGWTITINTGIPVEADSDLELAMSSTTTSATLSNALTYTISVTNFGPAIATNVLISDTLPAGVAYVGTNTVINGVLTLSAGTLAVSNGAVFTVSVTPTNLGYITNIVVATSAQPDPNSNNIQTNIALVNSQSADIGVTLNGTPNPVMNGGAVTYTIVVHNNGPSATTNVTAINTLPAGFQFNSATVTQGTYTNASGKLTWNVGALGSSSSATMTLVSGVNITNQSVLPSATNLDLVTVSSPLFDPTKTNNFAAIKTEVEPASLSVTSTSTTHSISWPVTSTNVALYGATAVSGPWTLISNPIPVNGIYTLALPGTNGFHYFSLGLKTH